MGVHYEVLTHHGTKLCIDEESGVVGSRTAAPTGGPGIPAIGFVPDCPSRVCFLMPEQRIAAAMRIAGSDFAAPIVPLRVIGAGAAERVALYCPRRGTYLCACPPADDGIGGVAIDRTEIGDWERWRLQPVPARLVPAEAAALGQALDFLLRNGLGVGAVVRFLQWPHMDAIWRPILEAVARLLDAEQIGCLGERLRASPAALASLQRIYAEDVDAALGLPRLFEWLASRDRAGEGQGGDRTRPGGPERLGRALDFLARHCYYGEYISLPHACNVMLRRAVRPARECCVIATARNEGIYLLEWIAYYRQIGAEAIFLYSNDNGDGSDALLGALDRAGVITWLPSEVAPGGSAQAKAYGHALGLLPQVLDFRWALICDLDEFLVFDPARFGSLGEYIAWQEAQPVDAVAFSMVEMGSGGQARWRDAPMVRRFTRAVDGPGFAVKTLLRPREFVHSTPHHPTTYLGRPFLFRNSDRGMHEWDGSFGMAHARTPRAEHAWINHYFDKSAEEFLWKWSRNRGDWPFIAEATNRVLSAEFVRHFMAQHEIGLDHPPARAALAAERVAPALDAEIARLSALPGVAAAAQAVKRNFRDRIGGIVAMFADAPGIVEAGDAGRRLLQQLRPAAEERENRAHCSPETSGAIPT